MMCNICGVNDATIHLTEIVNSQMMEVHLCESCAQEKGTEFKTHFQLGDLLAGFAEPEVKHPAAQATSEKKLAGRCAKCKMTYDEFGKTGRLGCSHCYESFSKMLIPLIRRVQRSTQHTGKRPVNGPKPSRTSTDLKLLQEKLRKSVQAEDFEQAARLRDEIRRFEENVKKAKGE